MTGEQCFRHSFTKQPKMQPRGQARFSSLLRVEDRTLPLKFMFFYLLLPLHKRSDFHPSPYLLAFLPSPQLSLSGDRGGDLLGLSIRQQKVGLPIGIQGPGCSSGKLVPPTSGSLDE
jgi:hypothetical protein